MSRSAAGGAGGEAGSEYRAGVGAYLAAHGLTGAPVGLLNDATASHPVEIVVEADEAVDDIVCRLSDSSQIFVQAKRKFGLDSKLKAALFQWIEAVQQGQLALGDLLVVVGSDVTGPALDLASALDRRRRKVAQVPSGREQKAMNWLTSTVGNSLDTEQLDDLMERGRIIQAPLDSLASSLYRESARLLEGSVVPLGSGAAAISALATNIRWQGARRFGSSIDDWLAVLAQAGIPILSECEGALGARRRATLEAIERYRATHAKNLDQIRLSRLLDDVPAFKVEDFLRGFDVHIDRPAKSRRERDRSVNLVHIVKRWRRLCLVGLPGSGKSTALEQVAASWASEPGSPLPIKISLRLLAKLCADRTDVPSPGEIVSSAADFIDRSTGRPVADELLCRLAAGTAGLLLDGLDECGAERGSVVDTLENLIAACHSECPVVLTTRASAASAVERLQLPVVTLTEPKNLESNIECLIEHLGVYRLRVNSDDPWVLQRKSWIKTSREQDEILWKVPLLATLAAILICDESLSALPTNRADVLHGAVRASIRDWEGGKKRHHERYQGTALITAEQLLDAFVIIGHELMEARTSVNAIRGAARHHFEHEWGKSRKEADHIATEAIRFWDELAGIYIVDNSAQLISVRTRLFAELADALWAVELCDSSIKSDWLKRRASQADQSESIKLAAQMDDGLADQLIHYALDEKRWGLIRLALAILETGVVVQAESLRLLVRGLNEARSLEASSSTEEDDGEAALSQLRRAYSRCDDSAWGWTVALSQVQLPPALREDRVASFSTLEYEEGLLARALVCLTNAKTDNRALCEDEAVAIRAAFAVQIPPESGETYVKTSRRSATLNPTVPLMSGHGEFALGAAKYLRALTLDEAKQLDAISERCGIVIGEQIKDILRDRGFESVVTRWSPAHIVDFEGWARRVDDVWRGLTSVISSLNDELSSADLSLVEAWSLPGYAAMIEVLEVGKAHKEDIEGALRDREAFARVVSLFSEHYGIDTTRASAQARLAEPQITDFRHDVALMMYCPPKPGAEQRLQSAELSPDIQRFAVDLLCRGSAYMAELAGRLIKETSCIAALELLPTDLSTITASRQSLVCFLVLSLRPSERGVNAEAWLAGDTPMLRRAGCIQRVYTFLGERHRSLDELTSPIRELLCDADWSIRATAFQILKERSVSVAEPTLEDSKFWSCYDCGSRNLIDAVNCVHCSRGSRTGL